MLYLWANCWSLSLCSPNLFYILLWPHVPAGAGSQAIGKRGKKRVLIEMYVFIAGVMIFLSGVQRMWLRASTTPLRQMLSYQDLFVHCLVITQQNRLAHHIIMLEMMMEDFIGTDFQLYVLVFNVAGWQRPNSFPCQC